MSRTLNDASAAPAALSAFLRGVERRGALFGELMCGDRDAGDSALAGAMRAFRNHAAALPMTDWPRRFWALLLATPQLRRELPLPQWPADLHLLANLQAPPRQALLLRLAAGLAEEEAAAVLAISLQDYQQLLAAACPRDAEGGADAVAWRDLAGTIQQQLRDLPPERLARLARLREAAIAGTRIDQAPVVADDQGELAAASRVRKRWPWIALVVLVCGLGLAATWWPQWRAAHLPGTVIAPGAGQLLGNTEIEIEELSASAPAATYDATTALLTHADFELLLDPTGAAMSRDADFLAWYLASKQAMPEAETEHAEPAGQPDETETSDAQF